MSETSTKPYLIRAIYEWCTDNGFTPYIAVFVDNSTNVPRENGQGMAFPVERSTPTTQAATERENNPPPKLAAVDSESAPAPVAAEVDGGPEDEPPPNVPRIGGKPALKVVK